MAEKKKMLVIEEDLVNARMIYYDLSEIITTEYASNWIEAVKYLREEKFAAVLVSLEVGDLPGLTEIFDFIHGIDPDYRIIPVFSSEESRVENAYLLMRSGIEYSLAAGWERSELKRIVAEILLR